MLRSIKYISLLVIFALVAASCGSNGDDSTSPTTSPADGGTPTTLSSDGSGGEVVRASLQNIRDCDSLLDYFKAEALKIVGPYGLDDRRFTPFATRGDAFFEESDVAALDAASGNGNGVAFSETNVQVSGVDEPDIVKTDGRRIVGITRGELWIVDTQSSPAQKIGSITLSEEFSFFELFLYEDKVLVIGSGYGDLIEIQPRLSTTLPEGSTNSTYTSIIEIDISSRQPIIQKELYLESTYISARRVGSTVNLVMESRETHDLPFVYATNTASEDRAEAANIQVIEDSQLSDWVPSFYTIDEENNRVVDELIAPCNNVFVPSRFSGLNVISLLTLDLDETLSERDLTAIVANGDTIYSSGKNLYVVHSNFFGLDEQEIWFHKFSTREDTPALYQASGKANGRLLNQFSLHETTDDHLWIVTTTTTVEGDDNVLNREETRVTESFVTSFRQENTNMAEVGTVGNIGKNEEVQSVRFIESRAYVVTFRRIDPFYVVDLSDSANPRVEGELKIPGFSSYLHPLGNDRLLGVGSSATEEGRVTGAKLSLFDASDPTDPQEVSVLELGSGYTDVTWEHRAFLYWAPKNRFIMPFISFVSDSRFDGALAIGLDLARGANALEEVGRFEHEQLSGEPGEDCTPDIPEPDDSDVEDETTSSGNDQGQDTSPPAVSCSAFYVPTDSIERALIIGETLWTVSPNYVEARNIDTLVKLDSVRISSSS